MNNNIKILLLEDSAEDAELIHRILKKEIPKVQFKLVTTRKEYIKELIEFQPDVILSDNSMPEFNASDALEIVQYSSINVPFILVTGTVSEEFAAGIIKAGADDYILKDRMARLPVAIETALEKKRAEKERKETRQHLAKSEERYRTLYERNYAGVYQTNTKGGILSCNYAFAAMFGYSSPAELQQKNASVLYFTSGDREAFISKLRREKQITNHETILKHKDGHVVHVIENNSLLSDTITGEETIEGIILDVTRQKKADADRERLSSIIEATSDFVAIVDINRRAIFLNSAGRKMTGYNEAEDISNKLLDDFVPEWVQHIVAKDVIPAALSEGKWDGEFSLISKQGKEIPVSIIVMVLKAPDGTPEFFCTVARDITERKKAKQQMEFDSNNLSALINNTNDLMWSVDTDFKLITCNDSFAEIIKTSEGKPVQKGDNVLQSTFNPVYNTRFKGFYKRAFDGESFTETEQNKGTWSEISFYPIYNKDSIIGTACFSHDITKRKKADEALQKLLLEKKVLAERMATILDTLPANIALLDEHGLIIDVNESWKNFANSNGFKGKNYGIGQNYIKITAVATGAEKEDGKIISVGIKGVLSRLTNSFEYEYPCHSPKEERWYKMIVTPLREKEKRGVVVMHLNVTEQRKNAAALEATLKELSDYKIALDESSIVSITDPKGILTYVNANFCEISKYNREELLGEDHRIINSSFHDTLFIKKLWLTISKGSIWRNEIKNKAKDGTYYWVDTTIVPFVDKKGKPIQYVAINKDITEQKLIEQELLNQKVQEQKKITRAIITGQEKERNHLGEELHDNINQILAGTKLFLTSAAEKNAEVKKLIQYPLELIDSSIEEIRLLCRNLVTPVNDVNLDEMIGKLIDTYNDTTSIKANFNYNISPGIIKDDLKLNIYRIIQEQMNNILKHAKAKKVDISIQDIHAAVYIVIKDDGVGFNMETSRKGIGISNMINRIESFNGKVDIITSPGNGTRINIELPY
jgi:two-component system sensor histidine kinase NreB